MVGRIPRVVIAAADEDEVLVCERLVEVEVERWSLRKRSWKTTMVKRRRTTTTKNLSYCC